MAATIEELREALQFAVRELHEAQDKFWVSHCNHPGDSGQKNKESLWAEHARQDKQMLVLWSDRAGESASEIREILAKE